MKNVLVIGAAGQIGSELVPALIKEGCFTVAGFTRTPLSHEVQEGGPCERVDILDGEGLVQIIRRYRIDTIYNLAALLSARAEEVPLGCWNVGVNGLINVLEAARIEGCAVFTPSSIGVFGPRSPKRATPQDTIVDPQTIYGITKVAGELLSDYYFRKYGVDTRSIRFPGLISHVTPPGGGTTDYAVDIYYSAVKGETFHSPIARGTYMPMMFMSDAIRGAISLMRADPARLVHRNSFNIAAMSFDPEGIKKSIQKVIPEFRMDYRIDALRQSIAESWPDSLDDTAARQEWDWRPQVDLDAMTGIMIRELRRQLPQIVAGLFPVQKKISGAGLIS